MNLLIILIGATIIQGTLLVFSLLASRHSYKTANYLLSGLIVLFTYYALIKILSNTNEIIHFPHLIRTYRPVFILACVAVYFYCKALTTPGFRFTYRDSIHLLPFGLYTLITLPFFLSDPATKIASLSLQPFTISWMIERGFFVVVFLFYFGSSYKIILYHQRRIKDIFSNLEKVKLDWLRNLLLVFGVIWMVALLRFLTAYGEVGYENKFAVPILLCLTVYLIGWYALRQPEIFGDHWDKLIREVDRKSVTVVTTENNRQEESAEFDPLPKYEYSSLGERDIARHKDNLINYLEQEKPYTDPDLKLQNLADHLDIPSYQVSQIINTELHQNFYDLINSLRINEAKHRLIDPTQQNTKIINIAYDVGFNSKSTFNTAFKKYTKMTPSLFKKSRMAETDRGIRLKVNT
jgi:AraC-like DNA-binding protein